MYYNDTKAYCSDSTCPVNYCKLRPARRVCIGSVSRLDVASGAGARPSAGRARTMNNKGSEVERLKLADCFTSSNGSGDRPKTEIWPNLVAVVLSFRGTGRLASLYTDIHRAVKGGCHAQ